ncbi:MAG: CDP-alcohol phosphatidyltransferase family protein [Lentisphaeria bacterium]|nr:CDP-alcohol phosphatidyltransferase family protein [Lentisphaeria bacterium]
MKKMNLSGLAKKHLKFLPNTLTIFNSICGFIAIIYTLRAYETEPGNMRVFCISAIMIFSAMVFDALDGLAARLLDAASEKGIQMDSLSDMVTFGVAPAVLVAIMTHSLRDWAMDRSQELLVYALCSIYIGCAALRLATYNVMAMSKEKKDGNYFSGLPSPGAAAAICVMVFFRSLLQNSGKIFCHDTSDLRCRSRSAYGIDYSVYSRRTLALLNVEKPFQVRVFRYNAGDNSRFQTQWSGLYRHRLHLIRPALCAGE